MSFRCTILLTLLATLVIGCGKTGHVSQPKEIEKNESAARNDLSEEKIDPDDLAFSNHQYLKDLEWMVGHWEDKDDLVDVVSDIKWDKRKNFLVQHFAMSVPNKKELSGEQIIGYDPTQKKIRSWIFDSEGGFGESLWYKEGDTWYAETTFTLADGRKGSALHVYIPIDKDNYTFASENRDIGGRLMPNIGPVKVVRK